MCCSFPPNVPGSTFLQQPADDTSGRGGRGLALCSHNCLFPAALFTFCALAAVHNTGGSVLRFLGINSSRPRCIFSDVLSPVHGVTVLRALLFRYTLMVNDFWLWYPSEDISAEMRTRGRWSDLTKRPVLCALCESVYVLTSYTVVPYAIKCCVYLLCLYRVFKKTSPNSKV